MSESEDESQDVPEKQPERRTGQFRIHNNVSALRHVPSLSRQNDELILSLERLSSGLKVVRCEADEEPSQSDHVDKLV